MMPAAVRAVPVLAKSALENSFTVTRYVPPFGLIIRAIARARHVPMPPIG